MQDRLQPQFKVLVQGVDVTSDVVGEIPVMLDQKLSLIDELRFNLEKGAMYLEVLQVGHNIEFWGGTQTEQNYRPMFKGKIKYLFGNFPDDGMSQAVLVCYGQGWREGGRVEQSIVYPSVEGTRSWANVDSLKASDIVRHIIEDEMGMVIGTFQRPDGSTLEGLKVVGDIEFTHRTPIKQNMTDWAFLRQLAKLTHCSLWTDIDEDGEVSIYFMDTETLKNGSKVNFTLIYPERNVYTGTLAKGDILSVADTVENTDFRIPKLAFNEIPVIKCSVAEETTGTIVRSITQFNRESGEFETKEVRIEENETTKELFYYELNEAKIHALPEEEQDKLLSDIWTLPFNEVLEYYIKIPLEKPSGNYYPVLGGAFLGRNCEITVEGNVFIVANQNYFVEGIAKWSSNGNRTWHATAVKHEWGQRGYLTQLSLKQ